LGQANRVEQVIRRNPIDRLGVAVAVAVVFKGGRDPAADDRGQPIFRVVCKGAAAIIEQIAVIIPGIGLPVNLG
jgi:hypothetical protein